MDKELTPEVITGIHIFGKQIDFHPHLHFLVTEGGRNKESLFIDILS
jgi:hypothetical protein